MSVLQQPVLPLDISVIQQSVLPLDVSVQQQPACRCLACSALGRFCLEELVQHQCMSVKTSFVLHLFVCFCAASGGCLSTRAYAVPVHVCIQELCVAPVCVLLCCIWRMSLCKSLCCTCTYLPTLVFLPNMGGPIVCWLFYKYKLKSISEHSMCA